MWFSPSISPRHAWRVDRLAGLPRPFLIQLSCFKPPSQQIGRNRVYYRVKLPRGATALVSCLDTSDLHQLSHAILTACKASIHKVARYVGRAVCAIAGFGDVFDGLRQPRGFTLIQA